jgi:hypothetical protein
VGDKRKKFPSAPSVESVEPVVKNALVRRKMANKKENKKKLKGMGGTYKSPKLPNLKGKAYKKSSSHPSRKGNR